MSIVNIRNIELVNNPAKYTDPYVLRIQFECIAPLKEDLEWKLIYVGSGESEKFDQELDSCMVGPIPVGLNSFEFSASPPTLSLLPSPSTPADLIGVTVIILSASYNDAEFVRVGYYVATNWDSEEYALDVEEGRKDGEMEHLVRNVKVDTPRVTRFSNKWDAPEPTTSSFPSGSTLPTSPSSTLLSAPLPNPTTSTSTPTNASAPRDPTQSALPAPITALPAPAPAPSPVLTTETETETEAEDAHPLASQVEDEDKMGKEVANDEGRGEEGGEGLSNAGGAALGEM
ncbi:ASF1 like histone chaperone-domain-containing protein [Mrakia frigida]|uniref:ASF1 family histone chaperone n=1 Tax=Mrakia frigida TaxID=29902 RepID=UPI003FCC0557